MKSGFHRLLRHGFPLLLAAVGISACIGDNGTTGTYSELTAGGGIGGTGGGQALISARVVGVITRNGGGTINDIRVFDIDSNTTIFLDDQAITESELRNAGPGYIAIVDIGSDVSPDLTSGTALSIRAETLLGGPVTSVDPLQVLGQTVMVTGDTVVAGFSPLNPIGVGDELRVSGYASENNTIQASRIEASTSGLSTWKLTGPVSNTGTGTFDVLAQPVNYSGVTPSGCAGMPQDGDRVKVIARVNPSFRTGDVLNGVLSVACISPGLNFPGGTDVDLPVQIEGLVTIELVQNASLPQTIAIGSQLVQITGSTVLDGGDRGDILLGAKLEVAGLLESSDNVLTAERIRFRGIRFHIQAPVFTDMFGGSTSVQLLGIDVLVSPLTLDEAGVLSDGTQSIQAGVFGFRDSTGQVFATRIEFKGGIDTNDVWLRGPVSAPPAEPFLEILGIAVDTTGMHLGASKNHSITPFEFFSRIEIGMNIVIHRGRYNPNGSTIVNGPENTVIAIDHQSGVIGGVVGNEMVEP